MRRITVICLLILAAIISAPSGSQAFTNGHIAAHTGAHAVNFSYANSVIGPIGDQRIFYHTSLPVSFAGTPASLLPAGVIPVVSYKEQTTNVVSYARSVTRPVYLIFYHEPEDNFATGAQFVSAFTKQSALIRSAGNPLVKVAMAANWYRMQPGFNGAGCSYIPPASSVNYYFIDVYEPRLGGLRSNLGFQDWLHCTSGLGRLRGIAEYGLGDCSGSEARLTTLKADIAYLPSVMPEMVLLSYWWENDSPAYCYNSWQFTDSATEAEWKSIEG